MGWINELPWGQGSGSGALQCRICSCGCASNCQRQPAIEVHGQKNSRQANQQLRCRPLLNLGLPKTPPPQVRAILADVEDRLKDWSPAARGMKAPLDGSGAVGATSCLCCDSRVRSVRDLQVSEAGVEGSVCQVLGRRFMHHIYLMGVLLAGVHLVPGGVCTLVSWRTKCNDLMVCPPSLLSYLSPCSPWGLVQLTRCSALSASPSLSPCYPQYIGALRWVVGGWERAHA
jgi:hypothetical protein